MNHKTADLVVYWVLLAATWAVYIAIFIRVWKNRERL